MKKISVLVVDDQPPNVALIKRILSMEDGFIVDEAIDGEQALKKLKSKNYDVLLTDWLMPKMNGAELIKRTRIELTSPPYIVMITAIQSAQSRDKILEIGADEFISKPIKPDRLLLSLKEGLARKSQVLPKINKIKISSKVVTPPFVAVVIAASTGGVDALSHVFCGRLSDKAAFFVVHHSPAHTLKNLVRKIGAQTNLKAELAKDSQKVSPGRVYFAPADKHLCIDSETFSIRLNQEPKENYVRPSADPLFRSAALAFGKYTLGIVLTGLGVDGTHGAAHIRAVGGVVLAQDPKSAIAPTMPNSVLLSGLTKQVVGLVEMNSKIESQILALASDLNP